MPSEPGPAHCCPWRGSDGRDLGQSRHLDRHRPAPFRGWLSHIRIQTIQTALVVQGLRIACQCGGHKFNPYSGKIPHVVRQLRPCTTTTEGQVPWSPQEKPSIRCPHCNEEWPLLATTSESLSAATETHQSQKQGNKNFTKQ